MIFDISKISNFNLIMIFDKKKISTKKLIGRNTGSRNNAELATSGFYASTSAVFRVNVNKTVEQFCFAGY